jgi:hypothetical protein
MKMRFPLWREEECMRLKFRDFLLEGIPPRAIGWPWPQAGVTGAGRLFGPGPKERGSGPWSPGAEADVSPQTLGPYRKRREIIGEMMGSAAAGCWNAPYEMALRLSSNRAPSGAEVEQRWGSDCLATTRSDIVRRGPARRLTMPRSGQRLESWLQYRGECSPTRGRNIEPWLRIWRALAVTRGMGEGDCATRERAGIADRMCGNGRELLGMMEASG